MNPGKKTRATQTSATSATSAPCFKSSWRPPELGSSGGRLNCAHSSASRGGGEHRVRLVFFPFSGGSVLFASNITFWARPLGDDGISPRGSPYTWPAPDHPATSAILLGPYRTTLQPSEPLGHPRTLRMTTLRQTTETSPPKLEPPWTEPPNLA